MSGTIKNRYEFVYLFDVENGNPNGDPTLATCRASIRDELWPCDRLCLKRKIRNFAEIVKSNQTLQNLYP